MMFKKLLVVGVCVVPVLAVLLAPAITSARTIGSAGTGIVASVPRQDNSNMEGQTMEGDKGSMEGEKGSMQGGAGMMTPGAPMTGALDQEQSGGMMDGEKMDGQSGSGTMQGGQSMMGGSLPATGSGDLTGWFLLAGFATFLLTTGAALRRAHVRR